MAKTIYSILTLFLLGTLACIPATAQTVTGSANVTGNLTINATGVLFNLSGTNTPANPLTPGSPNTGSFTGLTSGAIKNLPGLPAPGPLVIKSFATFNTPSGTIIFDLQSVAPGTGSAPGCTSGTIGDQCTPSGSPLTLVQTGTDSLGILVQLNGIAYFATAGPGSASSPASLTISTFLSGTIPQVLTLVATPTGIRLPCSATLNVTN